MPVSTGMNGEQPRGSIAMTTDIVPTPNISELARRHGLSRQTVRRRLANGWQPPVCIDGEIVEQDQEVATHGQADGHPLAIAAPPAMAVPVTTGHDWPAYTATPGHRW